jgi:hypothetical protein
MFRRRAARAVSRSVAVIEPLEDRRMLSIVLPTLVAAAPLHYAVDSHTTVSHSTVSRSVAKTAAATPIHTMDDDGGDDDGGSSDDGDSSGDDGGSDDGGESAGDTGDDDGSSDAGEGSGDTGADDGAGADDGGEAGATPVGDGSADGGEAGGSTVDSSPTDNGTPDNSGDAGAGTTDNTGDGTASADGSTPAPDDGGTDNTGTDTGVVYPIAYPYGDDLYDDNGDGTIVTGPTAPYPPAFGGTLTVRLPAHPVAGDAGVAKVDVFNTGGPAAGKAEIAIGVTPDGSPADAVRVADKTVPVRLGSDRVAIYQVPFKLPTTLAAGTYQFLALIDAGDAFGETANSNNLAFGPSVTIGAAAAPDVSLTAASAPHAVRAGHVATVAVHLQDTEAVAESGPMTVAVTAESTDGTATSLATVTRAVHVGRNGRATVRVQVPTAELSAGQYQLTVRLTHASPADVDAADKSVMTMVTVV